MRHAALRPSPFTFVFALSSLALASSAGGCESGDSAPPVVLAPTVPAGPGGSGGSSGAGGEGGGANAKAAELFAKGPYAVGYQKIDVVYQPVGGGEARTLPVHVWYPARDGGEAPATYSVGGIVTLPARGALAAPALAEGRPFPLAVYSHGSGGDGLIGYPYGEHFASQGWVVAAPSHVGNTAVDDAGGTAASIVRIALDRPHDVSAVIDFFDGSASTNELATSARADRVFLFGHSFGGYTTLTSAGVDLDVEKMRSACAALGACEALEAPGVIESFQAGFGDPRVAVAAAQAPALVSLYAQGQLGALTVPTMLMSGRLDKTTTDAENAGPAWAGLDDPGDLRVELPSGGHFSFVTICDDLDPGLLQAIQPGIAEDGCGPAFTPVAEAVPALSAYLLGFARWHLLGEDEWAPVLRGAPLDPAFVVSTH